jgi:hypothetical protein
VAEISGVSDSETSEATYCFFIYGGGSIQSTTLSMQQNQKTKKRTNEGVKTRNTNENHLAQEGTLSNP